MNVPLRPLRISKHSHPVTIESINFKLNSSLEFDPKTNEEQHKHLFLRVEKDGTHKYKDQITIEKGEKVLSCWIPINPAIGNDKLEKAIQDKQVGIWNYRCIWIKDHVITCTYGQEF